MLVSQTRPTFELVTQLIDVIQSAIHQSYMQIYVVLSVLGGESGPYALKQNTLGDRLLCPSQNKSGTRTSMG